MNSCRQAAGDGGATAGAGDAEAGSEPAPASASDGVDGGTFSVMPSVARSTRVALEQVRDDRVVDLLVGIELHLGGAVFEVELHQRIEEVVQLAALDVLAEEVGGLFVGRVLQVLQHVLEFLGRQLEMR